MSKVSPDKAPERKPVSAMPSTQPGPAPGTTRRRAVLSVAVLSVVAALLTAALWPGLQGGTEPLTQEDPTADAIAGMDGSLGYDESEAIALAKAGVTAQGQDARRALSDAVAGGQATLEDLQLPRSIPPVPEGYVPGGDVSQWVAEPLARPFTTPELPGDLSASEFTQLVWSAAPAPEGKSRNLSELDAVEEELDALREQLEGLDNGELDLLWGLLESQGLPSGRGEEVPDETPDDPEGTVEPDESGAWAAAGHAGRVLGSAEERLTGFASDLERIEALHAELVATVDEVMAVTPSLKNETQLRLADELIKRLGEIDSQLENTRVVVETQLASHKAWAEKARDEATEGLEELARAEAAKVVSEGKAQAEHLRGEAAFVGAEADKAKALLDAQLQSAIDEAMERSQETGEDVSAEVQLLKSHADALRAELDAAAQQKTNRLLAAADALEAAAQEDGAKIIDAALDSKAVLDQQVDDQLEAARAAADFALARAQYLRDVQKDAVEDLHDETLEAFMAAADRNVAHIQSTAWTINQASLDVLEGADGRVLQIEDEIQQLVITDLDYVLKVAEDYRDVPTSERKEAAEALEEVAGLLGGDLEETVAGADADGITSELLSTVQDVQAQVLFAEQALRDRGADLATV